MIEIESSLFLKVLWLLACCLYDFQTINKPVAKHEHISKIPPHVQHSLLFRIPFWCSMIIPLLKNPENLWKSIADLAFRNKKKTSSHQTSTTFTPTHLYHDTKQLNIIYSSMRIPGPNAFVFPLPFCAKVLRVLRVHDPHTGPRKSLESLGIQFGVPKPFCHGTSDVKFEKKNEPWVTINHLLLSYNSTSRYNSNFETIDYEPSSEKKHETTWYACTRVQKRTLSEPAFSNPEIWRYYFERTSRIKDLRSFSM